MDSIVVTLSVRYPMNFSANSRSKTKIFLHLLIGRNFRGFFAVYLDLIKINICTALKIQQYFKLF